jgi:3'-5' exoribonuclease
MKSPYVSDLQPDQVATGTFLVTHKDVRQKKSGEAYLSLQLADRTGELDAKMWENAAEVLYAFDRDDFVRVKGLLQIFGNRPQFTVHKVQKLDEAQVDFTDFFPASKRDRDEMFAELLGFIAGLANPNLKALLEAIFADEKVALAYRMAPAAKTVHHAWLGGLIEHVLSLCHLARFTASHYREIDLDLLLTGVILHDIGKIYELAYDRSFTYTTEGQLLGHIVIGLRMVEEKMTALPAFPPRLRTLIAHMILSHHGELEFGSPKLPHFPEALLLHLLDNLDSKMECMRSTIERDTLVEGHWTGYNSALDRVVLKKVRFMEDPKTVPAAVNPAPPARAEKPTSSFADKLRDALREEPTQ